MTHDERRELIERYREGYAEVERALAGIGAGGARRRHRARARGRRGRSSITSRTAR